MGKTIKSLILLGMILLLGSQNVNAQQNDKVLDKQNLRAEINQTLRQYNVNVTARACLKTIENQEYLAELTKQARKDTFRQNAITILKCALEKLDREGKMKEFKDMQAFIIEKADVRTYNQLDEQVMLVNNEKKSKNSIIAQNKRKKYSEDGFEMFVEDSLKNSHSSTLRAFEAIF